MSEKHEQNELPQSEGAHSEDEPVQPAVRAHVPGELQDDLLSAPGSPPSAISPADFPNAAMPVAESRPVKPSAMEQRGTVHTIHYLLSYLVRHADRGPKGAIVLLHDLPGGAFAWADVLPTLDTTNRAIYAFDMLGYGESEFPWPSDTSVWGHADGLSYAFRRLRLSEIVLVGVGLGAAVAQVLATRMFREGVAKLVLVNSYGYEYAHAASWPLPEMDKRQDPEAPKHTPLDAVLADLRNTLALGSARAKSFNGSKLDAYVKEWSSEIGKEMLFQHVRLMLPGYLNSVGSDLRKLTVPVLLVWGEADTVTPLALGERMAREIPGARFEKVMDAGHLILDDAPDAVGKLVADFAR